MRAIVSNLLHLSLLSYFANEATAVVNRNGEIWADNQATSILKAATQDHLLSNDNGNQRGTGAVGFSPDFPNSLSVFYLQTRVNAINMPNAVSVNPATNGTMRLVHTDKTTYLGSPVACVNPTPGTPTWKMIISSGGNLRIMSVCGTTSWTNRVTARINFPFWAYETIMGEVFENTIGSRTSPMNYTAGRFANIFFLDSGLNQNGYWQKNRLTGVVKPMGAFTKVGTPTQVDNHGQGDVLQRLNTNREWSLSPGALFYNIKIAENADQLAFRPEAIVQAIAKVAQTPALSLQNNTNSFKVISLLSPLPAEADIAINCAIQWAFFNGTYVFRSAGDFNMNTTAIVGNVHNPYAITIGGHLRMNTTMGFAPLYDRSNFGLAVDFWGPAEGITSKLQSNAFAAAYAATSMARLASHWPRLATNVNAGYRYLNELANTTLVPATTTKAAHSINARNRVLSINGYKTKTPSMIAKFSTASSVDFCGRLSLAKSTPNWPTLINLVLTGKANPTVAAGMTMFAGFSTMNWKYVV